MKCKNNRESLFFCHIFVRSMMWKIEYGIQSFDLIYDKKVDKQQHIFQCIVLENKNYSKCMYWRGYIVFINISDHTINEGLYAAYWYILLKSWLKCQHKIKSFPQPYLACCSLLNYIHNARATPEKSKIRTKINTKKSHFS